MFIWGFFHLNSLLYEFFLDLEQSEMLVMVWLHTGGCLSWIFKHRRI